MYRIATMPHAERRVQTKPQHVFFPTAVVPLSACTYHYSDDDLGGVVKTVRVSPTTHVGMHRCLFLILGTWTEHTPAVSEHNHRTEISRTSREQSSSSWQTTAPRPKRHFYKQVAG